MIDVAIFPVFYFLFLKLNLFPALHLCSVLSFPSSDWALIDCVINWKVGYIIFEAIISPSERNQNIQDNPEYNSVLPFRIIPKIFAVNMLSLILRKASTEGQKTPCSIMDCQLNFNLIVNKCLRVPTRLISKVQISLTGAWKTKEVVEKLGIPSIYFEH